MYRGLSIAVVVPAFQEERLLPVTLEQMPLCVDRVIVVDDASDDGTAEAASRVQDPRVKVVSHLVNRGVGAAIATGYRVALDEGWDAVAVMAADAQMDPADLVTLVDALIDEPADYVKGDRLAWPNVRRIMPRTRYAGTMLLGWLTRIPSGYPDLRDSQCGYTVARSSLLQRIPLEELYPRYGFPNDMLARVAEAGGALAQRPVRPVYATEASGLTPRKVILPISGILLRATMRRLKQRTAARFSGRGRAADVHLARAENPRTRRERSSKAMNQVSSQGDNKENDKENNKENNKGNDKGNDKARRGIVVLLALASLLAGFLAGLATTESVAEEAAPTELDKGVALFEEALQVVEKQYVDPVDITTLIYYGAWGAADTLDSHSKFMPPRAYKSWNSRIHGKNIGPGFEIMLKLNDFVVESVSPRSPAAEAGVEEGDILLAVDGEALEGMSRSDVRKRLRGESGTTVVVKIRKQSDELVEYELLRKRVKAVPVVADLLPDGIGHIQVRSFQDDTSLEVMRAFQALENVHGKPLNGLIVDMRNNLGGLLDESIALADLFLPPEKVVVSLQKRGQTTRIHKTELEQKIGVPMVVLINRKSASASELFAAALRDHGRATLVGWQTYGKGSVQSTYPLAGNSGLKITTSVYMTPNAEEIEGKGLEPDVRVVAKIGDDDDGLSTATRQLLRVKTVEKEEPLGESEPSKKDPSNKEPSNKEE